MPGLGTILFGASDEEKRRRREEALKLIEENPDLARTPEETNVLLDTYVKTGKLPEGGRMAPVRFETGQKTEAPLSGGGTAVTFPDTEVIPKATPLKMGPTTGLIDMNNPNQVIFPEGGERASRLQLIDTRKHEEKPQTAHTRFWGQYEDGSFRLLHEVPRQGGADEDRIVNLQGHPGRQNPQDIIDRQIIQQFTEAQKRVDSDGNPVAPPPDLSEAAAQAMRRQALPTHVERKDVPLPGIINMGRRFIGAGGTQPTFHEAPGQGSAGGASDDDATAYLKSIGAKVTPGNISWAKRRMGGVGGR